MTRTTRTSQGRLVGLPGGRRPAGPVLLVCSHCAMRTAQPAHAAPPATRVCGACGLGLRFVVDPALAPAATDAFLLVGPALQLCAVSRRAELLLGAEEMALVPCHLAEVLAPAEPGLTPQRLAAVVADAAAGDEAVTSVTVRPPGATGVRWRARIAGCGPPDAAVIVLLPA